MSLEWTRFSIPLFRGSKVGAGGVVPDTGIGIVGVYVESQHRSVRWLETSDSGG